MRTTVLLLLLALTGCHQTTAPASPTDPNPAPAPAPADGTLTTDRESYPAGATATLRLRNLLPRALGYNLCHSVLERRTGDAWRIAEGQGDRVCTMELRVLEPGGTATFSFPLAAILPAGEYRFRTAVEHMNAGNREQLASNTFRVTR